jgi:hypothetical protein
MPCSPRRGCSANTLLYARAIMFRTVLVALTLTTASSAHAGGGMFEITVTRVRVQELGDDGKLVGSPTEVEFTQNGTIGCHLDTDPKKRVFDTWFEGSIGDQGRTGHLRLEPGSKKGGASADVLSCTKSSLINNPIKVKPGKYRVSATVQFKKHKG